MDYNYAIVDKFAAKNLIKEQKSNFMAFKKLVESKSYVPIPNVLLEHIIFCSQLSELEKLLYLISYSLSFINLSNIGHRQVAMSAKKLSEIINCSKSQVLACQKNLSDKGYLIVIRQKNKFCQNNRNLLSPALPSEIFFSLSTTPDKKGVYGTFNEKEESHLSYLERTKQYIPLNYQILKLVTSNSNLTARQKVLWLAAYARSYKNSLLLAESSNYLIFTSCYKELGIELNYSSKIIAADLNALVKEGFLQKQRFYIKNGPELQDRCDKSLWKITLCLPEEYKAKAEAIEDRKGYAPRVTKPHTLEASEVNNKTSTPISDPDCPQFRPHINKDFKTYKDRSRLEADFQKLEKEEEKKEQININAEIKEAIPQKSTEHKMKFSINQNAYIDNSAKIAKSKKSYNLQRKSLSEIEPITEDEAILLRNSSGRDFSCSYMNKLVKRLAKLFPNHGFYTRKLFLSYMSKTLSQELRETTKTNNTDFTFKADERVRAQEKYLEEVETSYDTSMPAQLRKKIAGRFEGPIAYQILTSCDFQGVVADAEREEASDTGEGKEIANKQNQDENCEPRYDNTDLCADYHAESKDIEAENNPEAFDSDHNQESQNQIFVISLSKPLNLREHEQEMLLEQVRSVHGNKVKRIEFKQNCYVTHVDKSNKISGPRDGYFDKPKDERVITDEALLEAVPGSIWHKISCNLIAKYGIYLYKAWFGKSKMEAIIDGQNRTLSLKASTDFIASYVESNYFTDLRVLSSQENYALGKILT